MASHDLVSPPHFSLGKPWLREGVGPVPRHTALRWLGLRLPVWQAPLCSPQQETAVLSSLGSRKEERVWLRDLQAPEAEPGPAPENNLLGAAWAGQEGWAPGRRPPCLEMEMWAELQPYPGPQTCLQEGSCLGEERAHRWAAGPNGHLRHLGVICTGCPPAHQLRFTGIWGTRG